MGHLPDICLTPHRTKIICTVGPASQSPDVLFSLIKGGMAAARLNFAHGTFQQHKKTISAIRAAAKKAGRPAIIFADLPGPKIRVGHLKDEPIVLEKGGTLFLTTENVPGTRFKIPVSYDRLSDSVEKGNSIFLNDGFIELKVAKIERNEIECIVITGGTLLSGKGLNIPGRTVYLENPTKRDRQIMDFALEAGIDTFGISFVENAKNIEHAKDFAKSRGKSIYAIAKIERSVAVSNIENILDSSDAIMIARGDLGVEVPIEDVPSIQKEIIHKAVRKSCPVITATQMLLSMTENHRPTRAEANDVANAIQDGSDAVMLSEETAIGKYPLESLEVMARIATSFEMKRETISWAKTLKERINSELIKGHVTIADMISMNVAEAVQTLSAPFILTPTKTGMTPRRISRLKPEGWILALTKEKRVRNFLFLSYGVYPLLIKTFHTDWREEVLELLKRRNLAAKGDSIIITEGKFTGDSGGTDSMAILKL
ncbi:MAG: pyruvate kinase [Syntrophales bacterium]|jgi:pyruvate kinase|nr:pyruvate kinase [Syntrophales bacterium]MDY0045702.1 pyruvate kinase [Syntrophales bacterium]